MLACADSAALFKIFAFCAPSVAESRKISSSAFPEAERAVSDGDFRSNLQSPAFRLDEQFVPALRALAHANLEADEFPSCLPASRRSAPACIRRGLPCEPAGTRRPPTRTRTGAPTDRASASARTRPAALRRQSAEHRRRKIRRIGAHKCCQRLLEVRRKCPAGGEPAEARPNFSSDAAHSGKIADVTRIRSSSRAAPRSRIFTGPIPVWFARVGP